VKVLGSPVVGSVRGDCSWHVAVAVERGTQEELLRAQSWSRVVRVYCSIVDLAMSFLHGLTGEAQELDVSDIVLDHNAVIEMQDKIRNCVALRQLVLHRCSLGQAAFRVLGEFLSENEGKTSVLQHLVLSGNDCAAFGLGNEFCEGVLKSRSLMSLELGCCSLGDEGAVALFDTLSLRYPDVAEPPRLQELGLGCNSLGPAAARSLCCCLAMNRSLCKLDLRANALGPEGAETLADGLKANKGRIQHLDVSQNSMHLSGALALAACFQAQEFVFSIHLHRPWGASIGVSLDDGLMVTSIINKGLVEAWNLTHVCDEVCVGDVITQVNGEDKEQTMLCELSSRDELDMTVARRCGSLMYLDVCHNAIGLQGVEELRAMLGSPMGGSLQGWQLRFDGGTRKVIVNAS